MLGNPDRPKFRSYHPDARAIFFLTFNDLQLYEIDSGKVVSDALCCVKIYRFQSLCKSLVPFKAYSKDYGGGEMTFNYRLVKAFLFLSCSILLASCGPVLRSGHSDITKTYPPISSYQVVLTEGTYNGAYTSLGRVWANWNGAGIVPKDTLSNSLRERAAQIGANMVINVEYSIYYMMAIGEAEGLAIRTRSSIK